MQKAYNLALRYAHVISYGNDSKDLVHNAYIQYFELTGGNLFDTHIRYVFGCVKKAYQRRFRATQYIKNRELITRKFEGLDFIQVPDTSLQADANIILREEELLRECFVRDLKKEVEAYQTVGYKANNKLGRTALPTVLQGFEQGKGVVQISKEMNVSSQTVSYYKSKIKTIAQRMQDQLMNPFNGNRATIIERLKRTTYEKHIDKYTEFNSTNDWADANEWHTLLTNDKAQGLLIIEGYKESLNRNY